MAVQLPPRVDLDTDRGPELVRNVAAVAALATLAFVARLISKKLLKAKWSASEYTIAFGLVGSWAQSSIVIHSSKALGLLLKSGVSLVRYVL